MQVAQLLGNEHLYPLDLIRLARNGVDKGSMQHIQQQMGLSQKELADLLHLTPRTLQRMREDDKLPPAASGQLLEIARVYAKALEVFEHTEDARQWLRSPVMALRNEKPVQLLDTPAGIQWVFAILGRIEHGIYS